MDPTEILKKAYARRSALEQKLKDYGLRYGDSHALTRCTEQKLLAQDADIGRITRLTTETPTANIRTTTHTSGSVVRLGRSERSSVAPVRRGSSTYNTRAPEGRRLLMMREQWLRAGEPKTGPLFRQIKDAFES